MFGSIEADDLTALLPALPAETTGGEPRICLASDFDPK